MFYILSEHRFRRSLDLRQQFYIRNLRAFHIEIIIMEENKSRKIIESNMKASDGFDSCGFGRFHTIEHATKQ